MTQLEILRENGLLSAIDCHLANLLSRRFGAGDEEQLLAALVSNCTQAGHSCLDLDQFGKGAERAYGPLLARLAQAEQSWQAVGGPGDSLPLIQADGCYFLHRFWSYEQDIARCLGQRLQQDNMLVDEQAIRDGLHRYFSAPGPGEIDWQQVAAALAVLRPLTIISGGPGTGKTSIVAKVLAILFAIEPEAPRVAIAAPTGKAAMRLAESLQAARQRLQVADIPVQASTIHRLLGVMPGSGRFRHDSNNPLPADVVIIDEVSMIDVALMAKLLAAVPGQARLILLGDKDQLASVKPGAVFADLCGAAEVTAFMPAMAATLEGLLGCKVQVSKTGGPLTDSLVALQQSYRYGAKSQLGQVAPLVNQGKGEEAIELMSGQGDVQLRPLAVLAEELGALVKQWYGAYLQEDELPAIFAGLDRFRILTATRQGPLGVESINLFVEGVLRDSGLLSAEQQGHYHGQPVMVQHNDYGLGLFNGDVGVMRCQEDGELAAVFPDGQGGFRFLPPACLPQHDTVFAMTIHKSQGSEFGHLALLLPDSANHDFLSRELFYTGLTRASHSVTVFGQQATVLAAVNRQVGRMSGLGMKLASSLSK